MADFWSNLAEAMGWGKANHTRHLSDISEEERQGYRNQTVDAANKYYEDNTTNAPKIENARNNGGDPFTRSTDNFIGEYNSDSNQYETRVYDFEYDAPIHGDSIDNIDFGYPQSKERRTGKVLLRVPKNRKNGDGGFGTGTPWFDDKNFKGTNIGVYEAVLDDGTVLSADEFKDLIQANPYGRRGRQGRTTFKLLSQVFTDNDDKVKSFNNYKDSMQTKSYGTRWDANWRGFRPTNKY